MFFYALTIISIDPLASLGLRIHIISL